MPKTISRDELKQKMDLKDDFLLVETLPATAYHHNHLPGAINLPPDSVTTLASHVLPNQSAEIVVYCASPT
jgi:rhodanese-related sulfurtransferase